MPNAASDHEKIMRELLSAPFVVPIAGYTGEASNRPLGMKGSKTRRPLYDPYAEGALVLYTPPELSNHEKLNVDPLKRKVHVVVDPMLSAVLRPHQREGVKFMYECVTGSRVEKHAGCIMADEMGLGKTLQCITLMWTLLRQGPEASPTISKAIIVCPASLVMNWDREMQKWLNRRVNSLPIVSNKREDIIKNLEAFVAHVGPRSPIPVVIISYETFRLYTHILHKSEIGLVICDEGHRLKNNENQTYQALLGLKCDRRVLLSGTPVQNDLLEYYSLINFINPGMLGDPHQFKRYFENPITHGRDAGASDKEIALADERLTEMLLMVNRCIIRRTSALLTKYLPVKYEFVVCCRLTPLQEAIYQRIIRNKSQDLERLDEGEGKAHALSFIINLKKLCNHPQLVYGMCKEEENGFEGCAKLYPEEFNANSLDVKFSGKMRVLDYLLAITKKLGDDKFVLISNYTETLDVFVELCRQRGYKYVRLDGKLSAKKRAKLVEDFNDPQVSPSSALERSTLSAAGAIGIVDSERHLHLPPVVEGWRVRTQSHRSEQAGDVRSDWNPANDDQAMARIWRDGQKKICFIYRLLSTGTIEEKIMQRQAHKKALSSCVVDEAKDVARHFTAGELKTLFEFKAQSNSDTHDRLKCRRCVDGVEILEPPETADTSSDLALWHHVAKDVRKVPDQILKSVHRCDAISFVFHQRSQEASVKDNASDQAQEGNADGGEEGSTSSDEDSGSNYSD